MLCMNKQRLRKGGKLEDKWLGPYSVVDVTQYGCCKLARVRTGVVLKTKVNQSQVKYFETPIAPKAYVLNTEGSSPKDSAPEVGILTKGYCHCSNKNFITEKDDSHLGEENGKHLGNMHQKESMVVFQGMIPPLKGWRSYHKTMKMFVERCFLEVAGTR